MAAHPVPHFSHPISHPVHVPIIVHPHRSSGSAQPVQLSDHDLYVIGIMLGATIVIGLIVVAIMKKFKQ